MAYRSNLSEIPALVETLLREKQAWQVEIRHTYDMPHIPREFRLEEFMSAEEWDWLAERLAGHDPETVLLLRPPEGAGHRSHPEIGADGSVDPTPLAPPPPPSRPADTAAVQPGDGLGRGAAGLRRGGGAGEAAGADELCDDEC